MERVRHKLALFEGGDPLHAPAAGRRADLIGQRATDYPAAATDIEVTVDAPELLILDTTVALLGATAAGFHGLERTEDRAFRWTTGEARIDVRGAHCLPVRRGPGRDVGRDRP